MKTQKYLFLINEPALRIKKHDIMNKQLNQAALVYDNVIAIIVIIAVKIDRLVNELLFRLLRAIVKENPNTIDRYAEYVPLSSKKGSVIMFE